jgi:hypothetical protein
VVGRFWIVPEGHDENSPAVSTPGIGCTDGPSPEGTVEDAVETSGLGVSVVWFSRPFGTLDWFGALPGAKATGLLSAYPSGMESKLRSGC